MRARNPEEPFELDSADVEQLMAKLRAPTGTALAMRSRLREFQKRLFPKAASVGRGKRITYDIRETLQIALAFELVDIDLSSPRCINIVEQNRRTLDRLFVGAWKVMRRVDGEELKRPELEVERRRLSMHVALSATTCDRGAYAAFGDLAEHARPAGWPGRRSHISIDVTALVAEVVSVLEHETFRFLPSEIDAAFVKLGSATFGKGGPETWTVGKLEPHDDLVPR